MGNNTPQPEAAQTGKPVGVDLQHPCSGFAVVFRYAGNRYRGIDRPDDARGIRPDEVWIYGCPETPLERDKMATVAPALVHVPEEMIHRIPNAESVARAPAENMDGRTSSKDAPIASPENECDERTSCGGPSHELTQRRCLTN